MYLHVQQIQNHLYDASLSGSMTVLVVSSTQLNIVSVAVYLRSQLCLLALHT